MSEMKNRMISSEQAREIQIQILLDIDNFCRKNNMQYYMSYGTLLGAVRHKGFIPWDDDIDITMPYPDYIRFCETYSSDIYKVHIWKNERQFFSNYAKVEDIRTLQIEPVDSSCRIGINIDVTPMIGLPNEKERAIRFFKNIEFIRKILNLKQLKIRKERQLAKNCIVIISKILLLPVQYSHLNKWIDHYSRKYDYYKSKYTICVGSFNTSKEVFERELFGETILLKFEGCEFRAPSGYDAWLRTIFGDYMQLPPKEKQITHHSFLLYWRDGIEHNTSCS